MFDRIRFILHLSVLFTFAGFQGFSLRCDAGRNLYIVGLDSQLIDQAPLELRMAFVRKPAN
jgi:hypothetical protein